MIHNKRNLGLNVPLTLYRFYKVVVFLRVCLFVCLFVCFGPQLTLVSRADYQVVRSFPALQSDVTKVFWASRIEHQKLPVLSTGHGRNTCLV